MSNILKDAVGTLMNLDDYYKDFERNFAMTSEFWKLERGQTFAEPGDASWEAFAGGDWAEAMRLLEERREDLISYHAEAAGSGTKTYRIRIVDLPLTPYLQWELNLLKIRDETGGPIRILALDSVRKLEADGPLPEIYTMDDKVMYQAIYDDNGVLKNSVRYDESFLVAKCRRFISDLYAEGEAISDFFRREVAHLPPTVPDKSPISSDYLQQEGRPGPIRS